MSPIPRAPNNRTSLLRTCLWGAMFCAFVSFASSPLDVSAGDQDRYRYVLDKGEGLKVCGRMQDVLNRNFAYPWKRPPLIKYADDPNYGPGSAFSFPKLPGVVHDDRVTLAMSYSRLPTSAEFEAIGWIEGRVRNRVAGSETALPILLADIDLDNDGRRESVIKNSFMQDYYASRGSGGVDMLYVFPSTMKRLPSLVSWESVLEGEMGGGKPALITLGPDVPYRLMRPFVFERMTYLMGYQQTHSAHILGEEMHVVRYLGGGSVRPSSSERTPVQLLLECVFRMSGTK